MQLQEGLSHIDYLIHQPMGDYQGAYQGAYQAMEELYKEGMR